MVSIRLLKWRQVLLLRGTLSPKATSSWIWAYVLHLAVGDVAAGFEMLLSFCGRGRDVLIRAGSARALLPLKLVSTMSRNDADRWREFVGQLMNWG